MSLNKKVIIAFIVTIVVSSIFFIPVERYGIKQYSISASEVENYYLLKYYNIFSLPESGHMVNVKLEGQNDYTNIILKYRIILEKLLIRYAVIINLFLFIFLINIKKINKRNTEFNEELLNESKSLEEKEKGILKNNSILSSNLEKKEKDILEKIENFNKLLENKKETIPWIIELYSTYMIAKDEHVAWQLLKKSNPSIKGAEEVKRINQEKKELIKENKLLECTIKYYESILPDLEEVKEDIYYVEFEDNSFENNNNDFDNARKYLSEDEYKKLTSIEKYQLALDRYKENHKSKNQIGNMYEQYIGYLYETGGYLVYYQGINRGYNDLGRNLICVKNGITHIVQCKMWSKNKLIHENAINQLFGTTFKYWIDNYKNTSEQMSMFDNDFYLTEFIKQNNYGNIKAVIYSSTSLSKTAKEFAFDLGIEVHENFKLGEYPMIKCNINKTTKEKIYHLPFDQQYNNTAINSIGEKCVFTVKEAEELGFRRAKKWIEAFK